MEVEQTPEELFNHLREQVLFLISSSHSFDNGFTSEAKRISVVLRVLLHDTSKSQSLLKLLNKKNILFYDTSTVYNPQNVFPTLGLVMLTSGPNGPRYVAPLDKGSPPRYLKPKIKFETWWNQIVLSDKQKNTFTRKDLILAVSNKDGGAHIDKSLDAQYAQIKRIKTLGLEFMSGGQAVTPETGPELVSIRQICFEVIRTLKDEFPNLFNKGKE